METQSQCETLNANEAAPKPRPPGKGGVVLPPGGRPPGTPNRVTRTIREAVERAARDCHPKGLAGWLVERANGSLGDRQIFAAMVNKAMPLQVQASVNGGIRLELGWLGGRQIGASAAQTAQPVAQVLDLARESDGTYQIVDQRTVVAAPPEAVPAAAQRVDDQRG